MENQERKPQVIVGHQYIYKRATYRNSLIQDPLVGVAVGVGEIA